MNLEELLSSHESKIIEFKESTQSLQGILKAVIAFANTSGGTIVIGVEDKTRKVVGIENVLLEEERITNAIADSILPLLVPNIEIQTFREKEIILVNIPHMAGPYYLKSAGHEKGVFVRLGSTNRIADSNMLQNMRLQARNLTFDESPVIHEKAELDWDAIKQAFKKVRKKITPEHAKIVGLIKEHAGIEYPSNGGVILFGKKRLRQFPHAIIRCARFLGIDRAHIHDQADFDSYPTIALEEAIKFVERHTYLRAEFGRLQRNDIPEYPPIAVREAITNAVLHADYSMRESIMVAIFDDRIEITNPGGLTFNQTMTKALSGSSILRNYVIGLTLRELKIIERWGSGLKRIIDACAQRGIEAPKFEERDNEFRVTLYSEAILKTEQPEENQKEFLGYLKKKKKLSTKEAAEFWSIAPRNALVRLKALVDVGVIKKIGTSAKDPRGKYVLAKK